MCENTHHFYKNGFRVEHFAVRNFSQSGDSWAMTTKYVINIGRRFLFSYSILYTTIYSRMIFGEKKLFLLKTMLIGILKINSLKRKQKLFNWYLSYFLIRCLSELNSSSKVVLLIIILFYIRSSNNYCVFYASNKKISIETYFSLGFNESPK